MKLFENAMSLFTDFSYFDDFGDSNSTIYSAEPGSSVNLTCLSESPHGWTSTAPQFRLDKDHIVGIFITTFLLFTQIGAQAYFYYRRYTKIFMRWRSFWTSCRATILATFTTSLLCGSRMHLTCNLQRLWSCCKCICQHYIYVVLLLQACGKILLSASWRQCNRQ